MSRKTHGKNSEAPRTRALTLTETARLKARRRTRAAIARRSRRANLRKGA